LPKIAFYKAKRQASQVEPDEVAQAVDIPNDPYFNSQSDMKNLISEIFEEVGWQ